MDAAQQQQQQPLPPTRSRFRFKTIVWPITFFWVFASLSVNLGDAKRSHEAQKLRLEAQSSALESLIRRCKDGIIVDEGQINKELQLVGLREKPGVKSVVKASVKASHLSWKDAFRLSSFIL